MVEAVAAMRNRNDATKHWNAALSLRRAWKKRKAGALIQDSGLE
jgi:hypothetical protein